MNTKSASIICIKHPEVCGMFAVYDRNCHIWRVVADGWMLAPMTLDYLGVCMVNVPLGEEVRILKEPMNFVELNNLVQKTGIYEQHEDLEEEVQYNFFNRSPVHRAFL